MLSLPAWGAWIETRINRIAHKDAWSLPAWGAWIETSASLNPTSAKSVAPRVGSVD